MRAEVSFLLRFSGFAAFLALLYPFAMAAITYLLPFKYAQNLRYPLNDTGHIKSRMIDAERHAPVDLVFLGSSHAYRGFDTRMWKSKGYESFNLGSSIQTPIQSEVLALTVMQRLNPRVVIIEVHPTPFYNPGIESSLEFIANRKWDGQTLRMVMQTPSVMIWNAMAYGALRKVTGIDERCIEERRKKNDTYVDGGFVEHDIEHFSPNTAADAEAKDCEPTQKQWKAFVRLLAHLKRQGDEVILVEAPVTRWMREEVYLDHDRFSERMASVGRYIDMNGKVELDDSLHFFTMGHLNQDGVALFNAALIDTLTTRGWLAPPPRP